MGASVRQRGFAFDECDSEEVGMGEEMQFGVNNDRASIFASRKTCAIDAQYMGAPDKRTDGCFKPEDSQGESIAMGPEVRDDCEESSRKRGEKATAAQLMSMLQLQQFRCALTGELLTPEVARCDHVIPVSEGGSNRIENLQWVTDEVNRAKGVMTQQQFVSMCIKVAKWSQR